jgi:hypothetical protein
MRETRAFGLGLLEESKAFLSKASAEFAPERRDAFLHASLLLAFAALEAQLNAMAETISQNSDMKTWEKGILLEKRVALCDGEIVIKEDPAWNSLPERLQFLLKLFAARKNEPRPAWWEDLKRGHGLRNSLTHPRTRVSVDQTAVERTLEAIVSAIDLLFKRVYRLPFPAAGMGVQSRMKL